MADITADAQIPNVVAPTLKVQLTDKEGRFTPVGIQHQKQMHATFNATARIIPCGCTGTNVLTLTPNPGGPLLQGYFDYEVFSFVAEHTSTGAVTGTVVPVTGTLDTLKVYKTNGSAQASNGDITAGLHYTATYVDTLDSGAGGFVLR